MLLLNRRCPRRCRRAYQVSILVLVDVALELSLTMTAPSSFTVSILVLVDVALEPAW